MIGSMFVFKTEAEAGRRRTSGCCREKKVQTKDEVLAERMAEHIALKKVLGSFDQELGSA